MSKVTQCDRCAIIYDDEKNIQKVNGHHINTMDLWNNKTSGRRSYDLCPECVEDLNRWFFGKECAGDNESDEIVPGVKIHLLVSFHDELDLLT